MFNTKTSRKIDLSFLQYLTDEEIKKNQITLDEIRSDYPHTKNNNLEAFKLFYALNFKNLSEDEHLNLEKVIKLLSEREEEKFKLAFNTIECQQKVQELIQD